MICEACGESNRPGTEFCAFCGSYLAWDPAAAAAAERTVREERPAAPPPAPPPRTSAPVAPAAPTVAAMPAPPPAAPPQAGPPQYAPTPSDVADTTEAACPACGRSNPPGRRFCSRCGYRLLADAAPTTLRPAAAVSARSRDRAARREYRRSLPALYRWRRVLVTLGVVGALVAGLTLVGRDPVGFVVARYHDIRGDVAPVQVIGVAVEPPEASAPGSDPTALIDGSFAAWSMPWTPTADQTAPCGAAGTGVVVLSIPRTRVRGLTISAGLPANDDRRTLQARPAVLAVGFDEGPCQEVSLDDTADAQSREIDSRSPVSTIRIGVVRAEPPRKGGEPVLSITEIGVVARPS